MVHYSQHFKLLEEKSDYPKEAVEAFDALAKRLDAEQDFGEKFDKIYKSYMFPKAHKLDKNLKKLTSLAKAKGVNEYTMHFVFLMCCSELLLKRYIKKGIPEYIYWDTIMDLRYKLIECMDCEEVPGTFVAGWYNGFYSMDRFALGRFQYEYSKFPRNYTTKNGVKIKIGAKCLNFHIPSSGVPITDDIRLDSYKKAYEFFKDMHVNGNLILECNSWLLLPTHKEFLPENSNILRFMDDFEIYKSHESDTFSNGWRVYGKYSDLPIKDLPEDTKLRAAYKKWLLAGNKAGGGSGVIVFDGEKIIN